MTPHTRPRLVEWRRIQAYHAEERLAWRAPAAAGERPAHYHRALLTWRAARYSLDVALSPLPCRQPA